MKLQWFIVLIIILISIPHISANDTSDWSEVTVNKVTFKIPDKFSNGEFNKDGTCYSHGDPFNFLIFSLVKYDNLKSMYGLHSTNCLDIEETTISGHDAVIIYDYNNFYNHDYLEVFFTSGTKIFRIHYDSSNVTPELEKIIGSTPKSKMSTERFLNKLDAAQRDYIQEDFEKNLELDLEDYYRDYNDQHNRQVYSYWGSNGFGVGSIYTL